MKTAFMSGEAGDFNYGDQGMALAIVDRIKSYIPDIDIIATGMYKETSVLYGDIKDIVPWPMPKYIQHNIFRRLLKKNNFLKSYDIERQFENSFNESYVNDKVFKKSINYIEASDFVIDMGHGMINDIFGGLFLPYFYWLSFRLKKPLFISGQSIGPLTNPLMIEAFRVGLYHSHTIVLRDSCISKNILRDVIRLPETVNLVEAGDDTLDLIAEEPNWQKLPTNLKEIICSGEFIAFQWRPTDYTNKFDLYYLKKLSIFIEIISSYFKLPVVFVPTAWEPHPDIICAILLERLMDKNTRFLILESNVGPRSTKWILGRCRFGIGLSYHFHVWLLSQGRPSIGIITNEYYHNKIIGAYSAYGFKGIPITISDLKYGSKLDIVKFISNWSNSDRDSLLKNATMLSKKWHDYFKKFLVENKIIK